jgi:hypothetical protein
MIQLPDGQDATVCPTYRKINNIKYAKLTGIDLRRSDVRGLVKLAFSARAHFVINYRQIKQKMSTTENLYDGITSTLSQYQSIKQMNKNTIVKKETWLLLIKI